jgi:hypothetical protein
MADTTNPVATTTAALDQNAERQAAASREQTARRTEMARENVRRDRELSDISRAEAAQRLAGRPTPTQDENDRAKHGEHIMEHDDDGSGPEPHLRRGLNRQFDTSAATTAQAQTRQVGTKQQEADAQRSAAEARAAEEARTGGATSRRGSAVTTDTGKS